MPLALSDQDFTMGTREPDKDIRVNCQAFNHFKLLVT